MAPVDSVVFDGDGHPPTTTMRFTFRVMGTSYRCQLHPITCVHPGCSRKTFLRPLCPNHARTGLGVRVRRVQYPGASPGQCGLFAEREFRPGDLICPYLGRRSMAVGVDKASFPSSSSSLWWHCPESTGHAEDSGYGISSQDGTEFDASCERSYGAMVNHADEPANNAALIRLNATTVLHLYRAWRQRQRDTGHRDGPWYQIPPGVDLPNDGFAIHRVPSILLLAAHRAGSGRAVGIVPGAIWILAGNPIRRGEEITVSYGADASQIINVRVRTMPSLSTHR